MRTRRFRALLGASMMALLLGALVLPASVGAHHFNGSTKSCTPAAPKSLTFECTFHIQLAPDVLTSPGQVITVTQVGNATYQSLAIGPGTTCPTGAPVQTSPTTFTITTTANCAGKVINVTETLKATGTGGGTECQQPQTRGNAPLLTICAPNFSVPTVVGPPTDKDQCKDGGFDTFNNPAFKNQGDCVSFVATGGKNPGNG